MNRTVGALERSRAAHAAPANVLPSHLLEVCNVLAKGILRLRIAREDSSQLSEAMREIPLHFTAHQRGHAKPKPRRLA